MKASPHCPAYLEMFHSCTAKIWVMGWKVTTFLKKANLESPSSVWGKYVTEVGRGHEMMETSRMPKIIAPLTRYIINMTVRRPPQKIPIHMVGLLIFSEPGQMPVLGSMNSGEHPASSRGVDVAPVISPIPAE
jgi:hypothetical protein